MTLSMGFTVLSLFDGIAAARVAFDTANIPIKTYYASEIDQKCVKLVKTRYPDTKHLGDVKLIDEKMLDELDIDILIRGSPCQDLSISNPKGIGIFGDKSILFFEYSRILKILQKKKDVIFVFENVFNTTKKESWEIITEVFYHILMF